MVLNTTKNLEQVLAKAEPFLRLNQCQPEPRPHRNPTVERMSWQLKTLNDANNTVSTSKIMLSSSDAHCCKTPFEDLKPIKLREMEVPKIHHGKYLVCKVVGKPVADLGVHVLVEDLNGDVEEAGFYNFRYNLDDIDWISVGTILIVKEPWLQYSRHKTPALRIDSPSDVIFVDHTDEELLDKIGAKQWLERASKNAETWRERANDYFKNGKFEKALFFYDRGIRCNPDLAVLYLNKALTCLKIGAFYDAYQSAKMALEKGGDREKALCRMGQAAYGMREWQKASKHFLEVLKEFRGQTFASEQFKRTTVRLGEQRYGKFDFKRMFTETLKGACEFDVADYMGPIEIVNTPGKGRGVVATKDIPKGTLLLVSKAISSAFHRDFPKRLYTVRDISVNDPRALTQMLLCISTVQNLKKNPQMANDIYNLYAGDDTVEKEEIPEGVIDVARLEKICISNGIQSGDDDVNDEYYMFSTPSYFNHSCLANAYKQKYGDVMVIHATTDIKKGEEIFLAALSPLEEYSIRKEFFASKKFVCKCKLCEIDSKDELCAKRYEMIKEFKEFAEKNPNSFKEVIEMGEPILKKIRETYTKRKEFKMVLAEMLNILYPMYCSVDPAKCVNLMEELMTIVDEHHIYIFDMPRVYYLIGPLYSYFGNRAKAEEMFQKALKMSLCTDIEHLKMKYPVQAAP